MGPNPILDTQLLSHIQLSATPWTVAHEAPLSMGFPRQEYWGGLPFDSSGDLPDSGIKPTSPALQANSLSLSHLESPGDEYTLFVLLFFRLSCSCRGGENRTHPSSQKTGSSCPEQISLAKAKS